MVRKTQIWLHRKRYILLTQKPQQMMNINVKVTVKVTNGTFSKKVKKNSDSVIF